MEGRQREQEREKQETKTIFESTWSAQRPYVSAAQKRGGFGIPVKEYTKKVKDTPLETHSHIFNPLSLYESTYQEREEEDERIAATFQGYMEQQQSQKLLGNIYGGISTQAEDFLYENTPQYQDEYQYEGSSDVMSGRNILGNIYSQSSVLYEETVSTLPPRTQPRPRQTQPRSSSVPQVDISEIQRIMKTREQESKFTNLRKNIQSELENAKAIQSDPTFGQMDDQFRYVVDTRAKTLEDIVKKLDESLSAIENDRQNTAIKETNIADQIENIDREITNLDIENNQGDLVRLTRFYELSLEKEEKHSELKQVRAELQNMSDQILASIEAGYSLDIQILNDHLKDYLEKVPDDTVANKAVRDAMIEILNESSTVMSFKMIELLSTMAQKINIGMKNAVANAQQSVTISNERIAQLEEINKDLVAERDNLKTEVETARKQLETLQKDTSIADLQKQVADLEEEKANQQRELQASAAETRKLQTQLNSLNALKKEIEELVGPIVQGEEVAAKIRNYITVKNQEIVTLQQRLTALQNQTSTLEETVENFQNLNAEKKSEFLKATGLRDELDEKNKRLQVVEDLLVQVEGNLNGEHLEWTGRIQNLSNMINQLHNLPDQFRDAKKQIEDEFVNAIQTQNWGSITNETIRQALMNSAEITAKATRYDTLSATLADPNFTLNQQTDVLAERVRNMIKTASETQQKTHAEAIRQLQTDKTRLEQQLKTATEALTTAQASDSAAVRQLQAQIQQMNSALATANLNNQQLAQQLKDNQKHNSTVAGLQKQMQDERIASSAALAQLQRDLDLVKATVLAKEAELTAQKTQHAQELKNLKDLHKQAQDLAQQKNLEAQRKLDEVLTAVASEGKRLSETFGLKTSVWDKDLTAANIASNLHAIGTEAQKLAAARILAVNQAVAFDRISKKLHATGFMTFDSTFIQRNLAAIRKVYGNLEEGELNRILNQSPVTVDEKGNFDPNGEIIMEEDSEHLSTRNNELWNNALQLLKLPSGRNKTFQNLSFKDFSGPVENENNRVALHNMIRQMVYYRFDQMEYVKGMRHEQKFNENLRDNENFKEYVISLIYSRILKDLKEGGKFNQKLIYDNFYEVVKSSDQLLANLSVTLEQLKKSNGQFGLFSEMAQNYKNNLALFGFNDKGEAIYNDGKTYKTSKTKKPITLDDFAEDGLNL